MKKENSKTPKILKNMKTKYFAQLFTIFHNEIRSKIVFKFLMIYILYVWIGDRTGRVRSTWRATQNKKYQNIENYVVFA